MPSPKSSTIPVKREANRVSALPLFGVSESMCPLIFPLLYVCELAERSPCPSVLEAGYDDYDRSRGAYIGQVAYFLWLDGVFLLLQRTIQTSACALLCVACAYLKWLLLSLLTENPRTRASRKPTRPIYAASCMSIRSLLQTAASPSDDSIDL